MKTSTTIKRLMLLLLLLVAKVAYPQAPAYEVYITNETYPSVKTFQFDIWVKKTGVGTLELSLLQFGVNVNTAWRAGGTISATVVSSMFTGNPVPTNANMQYNNVAVSASLDRFNITSNFPSVCGGGVIIPDTGSCATKGIKFATIQFANTANWASTTPNLAFNFSSSVAVQTVIGYLPAPCNGSTSTVDCTAQGTFFDLNNPGPCYQNLAPACNGSIVSTTINALTAVKCFGATTGSFTVANVLTSLTSGMVRYTISGGNTPGGSAFAFVTATGTSSSKAY